MYPNPTDSRIAAVDPSHPVYNAIPGRYVNRIGKGTYKLNGTTYHTEKNDGQNTLHGGTHNWSYRFWNVTALTNSSITFSIDDATNSSAGFPGSVLANVTYSLTNGTWHISMSAIAPDTATRKSSPFPPLFFPSPLPAAAAPCSLVCCLTI